MKLTKNQKAVKELFDPEKMYSVDEAVTILKKSAKAKFDEYIFSGSNNSFTAF